MRKEIFKEIKIPDGVDAEVEKNTLSVNGKEGKLKRKFDSNNFLFEKKGRAIVIGGKDLTKKDKRILNTIVAHIKNMINGVQQKFEYKLKIVYSHFPITVELKGNEAIIKNFLGEKISRRAEVLGGTEVSIDGNVIRVTSNDKELAGQTAANFEKATVIIGRDRRIFQDGIFITNKPGREI
ncbi:MAG: 50S ribosomal protein L6 [Nanoarchaeota archaeon]|mgnify:CR=1 FL=1